MWILDLSNIWISFNLEIAPECMPLSADETEYLMALKADKAMWTTCCKSIWRQKARMNWCKLGDRNTKIFHLRCSNRWRKNSILRISDGSSSFTNALSIKKVILDHFKDRFCQLKPFSGFYPNMALQYLSSEMGLNLELPFSLGLWLHQGTWTWWC